MSKTKGAYVNEHLNHEDNSMPLAQDEEAAVNKKYGGIVPGKPPLISKDHERAFFDSADWALGKQGGKLKGPVESLRPKLQQGGKLKGPLESLKPKLQPTPHQQSRARRSVYASADSEDGGNAASEDANCIR